MIPNLQTSPSQEVLYRVWRAAQSKAVLLLVHGLGGQSSRWEFLADYFLARNISSYALELKGFGHTSGTRGHVKSFDIYQNDIIALREIITKENPSQKIFLLGESLGGLIVFLSAAYYPQLFSGLISMVPAFKSRLQFSIGEYLAIFAALVANPARQFSTHFNAAMCTGDTAMQQSMNTDPYEYRYASAKFLVEALKAQLKAGRLLSRLTLPSLFLVSGKDFLVDTKTSKRVFQKLSVKDKTILEYPDMLHALSIEQGKEKVFSDIAGWISSRTN